MNPSVCAKQNGKLPKTPKPKPSPLNMNTGDFEKILLNPRQRSSPPAPESGRRWSGCPYESKMLSLSVYGGSCLNLIFCDRRTCLGFWCPLYYVLALQRALSLLPSSVQLCCIYMLFFIMKHFLHLSVCCGICRTACFCCLLSLSLSLRLS